MSYSNINRVVIVGRLTADPELRALPSGTSVCNLRVACNGARKSGNEYMEKPNFFRVSVFGGIAETAHRYLSKGRRVAIDGRLDWREWEADGGKRQTVEIVAESVEFLDGGGSSGSRGAGDGDGPEQELEDGLLAGEALGATDERELVGVGAGIEDDVVF